jgi:hypothetical protein
MAVARSKEYWTQRAIDKCLALNIEFLGFVQEHVTTRAKVILKCYAHGIWKTNRLDHLLAGISCPDCGCEKVSQTRKKDDSEHIASFLKTGEFDSRYTFCNLGKQKWSVKCSVCASDVYSEAGLCNGIFNAYYAALREGFIPCRCGCNVSLTEDQTVFAINKKCEDSIYKCISYNKLEDRLCMRCDLHGEWVTSKGSVFVSGSRCPSCAKTGFDKMKPACIYVLKIKGPFDGFVGYGITNNKDKRMRTHKRNLKLAGYEIESTLLKEMSGESAYYLERQIKCRFPLFETSIEGFKTESSTLCHYEDIVGMVCF